MDKLVKVKYELLFILLVIMSGIIGLSFIMWIFRNFF